MIRTTRVGTSSLNSPTSYASSVKQPTVRLYNDRAIPKYIGGTVVGSSLNDRIFTTPYFTIFS